ncbi:hypothetical protein KTN05_02675 [Paracoccus sp. Z118]|uniref:hypothetical protein n=1 Tax=Paracoccus sp. Z118 TaxID=2851017 RepID=UPI001C2C38CA|nr:hypothetical protein [Paracoccus sp. Z118]MBV0890753.1 hypothetical protein [Paracoccus sp. Z118]
MTEAKLRALAHVAQLKSDLELRRFAAFRAHVVAVESRVGAIRGELGELCAAAAPDSLPDLRAMAAIAGRNADSLLRAEAELSRLAPGFAAARAKAAREFGRARVLAQLTDEAAAERRERKS